jgi:hypothetical protein
MHISVRNERGEEGLTIRAQQVPYPHSNSRRSGECALVGDLISIEQG